QTKIGVIDIQRAIVDTAEIKKAVAELEARYKPRQEEMAKLQSEIQAIQQKLQTPNLTVEAQQELTAQGQRKQRELQRLSEDLQSEVNEERNEILARSGERMRQIVTKVAEAKGLDVVLEAGNAIYVKPILDITKDAIAEYDKAYPAN
ncbi:MAG: OmpH family outer membrane protein, partial [Bryobacteraceae bacterium]|nr:OmpH family outer membrane protein [Bryobacteraceae bacterium]